MSGNQQFPLLDDQNGILTITGLVDATGKPIPGLPLPASVSASSSDASQLSVTPVPGQPLQFNVKSLAPVTAAITDTITIQGTDVTTGQPLSTGFDFVVTHDVPAVVPVGFAATFDQIAKNA